MLSAQSSTDALSSMEMSGTIGSYPVGLNYTARNNVDLVAAHYFYVSQLKNIALNGSVHGQAVELQGADGSTFHLHFIGNGSNGNDPLTFYNSIGLAGTWYLNGKTLPVQLMGSHSTENPGRRLYTGVTSRSDAEFEQMVQAALSAILSNDPVAAARYVAFPLRVNFKSGHMTIRNASALKAAWIRTFPAPFRNVIRSTVPHEMFVHNGEAMLGNGDLWFGDKGLISVNSTGR